MIIRAKVNNEGKVQAGASHLRNGFAKFAGKEVSVEITEWKNKRSTDQNALMHKMFTVYGDEIGYTMEEAKWLLKKMFGINRLMRNKKTGTQELLVRNTSSYNIEEMTEFLRRVLQHMEYDCGIIIDPKERKQWRIDELTGNLQEVK